MKKIASLLHAAVMKFVVWGWPILLIDVLIETRLGTSTALWRDVLNTAAFAWIVCAPVAPLTLLLSRERRERAMAKLCGLREGDERERAVTGEAARATLLLALSLETALLALSLVNVSLVWNPRAAKGDKHGMLTVGLAFRTAQHLDPFGALEENGSTTPPGAPASPASNDLRLGSFLLSPSSFPILALLILIQLAAFKAFSGPRYAGDT